jgi:hypothetical protein
MKTTAGPKCALPVILTNRESRLVKAAIAVTEAKERHLDDKPLWRPLHALWEREVLAACPSYRPLKTEYFGVVCNSGTGGDYYRGAACLKCQFLDCDNDPRARSEVRVPLPVVPLAAVKESAARFAEIARAPQPLEAPAPVVTHEQIMAIEMEIGELLECVDTYIQALPEVAAEPETAQHYRDCIRDGVRQACEVAGKLPLARRAELYQLLAAIPEV